MLRFPFEAIYFITVSHKDYLVTRSTVEHLCRVYLFKVCSLNVPALSFSGNGISLSLSVDTCLPHSPSLLLHFHFKCMFRPRKWIGEESYKRLEDHGSDGRSTVVDFLGIDRMLAASSYIGMN